ncbi:MAG: universal stress protein [Spirochaetales bacterium]|nr:universal stress protein [Spirochaetales bacterium]
MPYRNVFKKILFCTDFNTDAMTAFHYTLNIASGNENSKIIIFHAIPEPDAQFWKTYIYETDEDVDAKAKHDIDKKIKETYIPIIPDTISYSTHFAVGNVGEEILTFSEENDTDLIVIGRGAGANMVNRLLGNFTEKIIRKSKCPVLVVPDENESES